MRLDPFVREVDQLVERVLGSRIDADLPCLARGVAALSALFTRGRADPSPEYLADHDLRRSYLAYFFPVNFAKVHAILDELPADWPAAPAGGRAFRALDLGSGPGPASLATLNWLLRRRAASSWPVELVLVERTRSALGLARAVLEGYGRAVAAPSVTVRTLPADLERAAWPRSLPEQDGAPYDLIVVSNCLNELFRRRRDACERRARVLEVCLERLAHDGTLIVVEPASRPAARALHRVRDLLLARARCTVYSPCLHALPCPALAREDDWCHEERPWHPPEIIERIDRRVGFIKDALKFSYAVLRRDGRTIVECDPNSYRVVSELRKLKGEKRAWLCNELGRAEVGRLDRARSEHNAALDVWHRGAIVRIDRIVRKNPAAGSRSVGRIPAEARVEIVSAVRR